MLEPRDKGLMGTTLHFPYEIKDAKEYFGETNRGLQFREGVLEEPKAGSFFEFVDRLALIDI